MVRVYKIKLYKRLKQYLIENGWYKVEDPFRFRLEKNGIKLEFTGTGIRLIYGDFFCDIHFWGKDFQKVIDELNEKYKIFESCIKGGFYGKT